MIRVGITGQSGFIGSHLYNYLNLKRDQIVVIPFQDSLFESPEKLKEFVKACDTVIHLAAVNRHNDPEVIYNTNIRLVRQLITALEESGSRSHVIMASSIQEERDNYYGKSKRDGRILFEEWAGKTGSKFTGLVIPNVFGPFGNPFYNSVIATFSYQLTHNQVPVIEKDSTLPLIYVGELVHNIYSIIIAPVKAPGILKVSIPHTAEKKVSELFQTLSDYKTTYLDHFCFPELNNKFERDLFNTFRSYIDYGSCFPVRIKKNEDRRGVFCEAVKTPIGGQFSFSTTLPGVTRGNHFHTRKIERFIVIKGKAIIKLRRIGEKDSLEFNLDGKNPSFVDIPVWYTHSLTNSGEDDLISLFWTNEYFDSEDSDTFYEDV